MLRRSLPVLAILAAAAAGCATPAARPVAAAECECTTSPTASPMPEGGRCAPTLTGDPVFIALDAGFGDAGSSAEGIRNGILIALEEINSAGGVLGGRPLTLEVRRDQGNPAQSLENLRQLAATKDLVAVYCGRSGPTVMELLPAIHELGLPLLDPWNAADAIVENGRTPNYAFRLSLRDDWTMPVMLEYARALGARRIGLLLLDTARARGSLEIAERLDAVDPSFKIVGMEWLTRTEPSLLKKYRALQDAGAQAILLAASASEAQLLIKEVASLPSRERLPIVGDWGLTEGALPQLAAQDLRKVELAVVQTYSFIGAGDEAARRVVAAHDRLFKSAGARTIASPVGVAHAYDLTHILARAINLAGSTDRKRVRDALEQLGPYSGLVRTYAPPFTEARHEALAPEQVFMAEYAQDGALEPIRTPRRRTVED